MLMAQTERIVVFNDDLNCWDYTERRLYRNEKRIRNIDAEVETLSKLQYAEEKCRDVKSHKEWRAIELDLSVGRSATNT